MRTGFIASLVAAPLLAAPIALTHAQPDTAAEQRQRAQQERQAELERRELEREEAREQAEAARREAAEQREAAARERADLQSEIARARRDLEEAAREVARLSAELARPMVQDVQRRFRYTGQRVMLGINIDDTERGVLVAGVTPNGPAAAAGIAVGETIVAIDGANLAVPSGSNGRQSPSELLFAQLANVDPGESVTLRMLAENGAERDVTVVARELSPSVWLRGVNPPNPPVWRDMRGPWFGVFDGRNPWQEMQLVALTPELGEYFGAAKGLLVVRGPQSDALQLRDGDVILDIGGREPTSPEHALRILGSFQPGEAMKITVMRKQRRQTLEFAMPGESPPQ